MTLEGHVLCVWAGGKVCGDGEGDASGHEDVVVVTGFCAVGAVLFALVGEVLVDGIYVALYIPTVAHVGYLSVDNQLFCLSVGVEADASLVAFLPPEVEVAVC